MAIIVGHQFDALNHSSLAARGLVRALSSASIRVGMSRLSNEPLDFLDWRQQGKLVGVPPAKRRWRGDIGSPAPFRSDRRPEVVIEPSQQAKINRTSASSSNIIDCYFPRLALLYPIKKRGEGDKEIGKAMGEEETNALPEW